MHWFIGAVSVLIGIVALLYCGPARSSWPCFSPSFDARTGDESWNVLHHQGGNSPWRQKVDGVVDDGLAAPEGCLIDQIHMMSRHAERYPTVAAGIRMLELYHRMKKANQTFLGDLSFVNDWDFFAPYPAEQFELLTLDNDYAGSLQAFATGVKLRTRYASILEQALGRDGRVRFWAGNSKRVNHTARYFASGFFGTDWPDLASLVIVPKGVEYGGNSLSPGRGCPGYINNSGGRGHAYGIQQLKAYQSGRLPKISARLQLHNPQIEFSTSEIYSMQEMCGFETLAKGHSDWCKVFTHEEWEDFEYGRDLLHFYRAGPGNPYAVVMGSLWLNATTDLLRQGPDAGPLFLSFNHDGDIVALLAALDLFPQVPELSTERVDYNRTWRTSDVVPMGGRVIFERFVCPARQDCWDNSPLYPNHIYCNPPSNHTFVRVNINDGIVRIPGCDDGPGSACPLDGFVARVRERGERAGEFKQVCGLPEGVPDRVTFLHQ